MIGIYKITNPEGKVYVGSSKDVLKRIKRGYIVKTTKRKRFIHLSIDKFGIDLHSFECIEECKLEDLFERERFWQERLNCLHPNGLNRNLVACKGKRQIFCEDTLKLMSSIKIGSKAWNKGIPTWESTKNTIKNNYCPTQRRSSTLILDMSTGVYFYCFREASLAYKIPKQTLKMNLTAPNKDCRKNKTSLIIV